MNIKIESYINEMIAKMESNDIPLWDSGLIYSSKYNPISKTNYKGFNILLLSFFSNENFFVTFKQAQSKKLHIKAGSKSLPIVYFEFLKKIDKETGIEKSIPMLKYYNVFGWDCIEESEEKKKLTPESNSEIESISMPEIESYIANTKAIIKESSSGAYYKPSSDEIYIPEVKRYKTIQDRFHTIFHELLHWTGHESRLKRIDMILNFTEKDIYSKEELTAEIGSGVLSARFNIGNLDRETAYCKSWCKYLKDNKMQLISASNKALAGIEYLDGLQV